MYLYEVNIEVSSEIKSDFLSWIDSHVSEVLSSNNFYKAIFFQQRELDNLSADSNHYVVQYYLHSAEDYHKYIENFAPKLRKDGQNKFGDKLKLTRRILESIDKKI